MKLRDECLIELFDNFPLLREVIYSRYKIGHAQFYALSTLRTSDINLKVQESLEWISSQVEFIPPQDISLDANVLGL